MNLNTKTVRNRTLKISQQKAREISKTLIQLDSKASISKIRNTTIRQDTFEALQFMPDNFVDLLILDPPYNLYKTFNSSTFTKKNINEYAEWIDDLINRVFHTLKENASIYFCSDWYSSTSVHLVLEKYFKVRNRITWEREKGRGSKSNWKQNSEDIWFCTLGNNYTFNVEDVKLKRKVIAPYKNENGEPKDWDGTNGNFRITYPSNIWTDISVPFWSMPENTEHPTQKPEKLIAKLVLASTNKNDFVFDPFLGSGTSSVVAKKLGRSYCGIEIDPKFAAISEYRLVNTNKNDKIQGYTDKVFWERNTLSYQSKNGNNKIF